MKIITINGTEYTLEYSFMAAEHNQTVQKMFDVLSGTYIFKKAGDVEKLSNEKATAAMIDGTGELVADIPHIVKMAFYSGLLEHHNVSESEAYELMKTYMKENKFSFRKLFEDIKDCMSDDGFFDLSGLTEMIAEMNETPAPKKKTKTPQDHKKKQIGTN